MTNEQKTAERVHEIARDMEKSSKQGRILNLGATALIVCENRERVTPMGEELVPRFFVTKIHNGHVVSEQFV